MNRLKTLMLLAVLTALLMWAGQALGGPAGLWFALAVAAVMNIGAYWFSDKIVLRMYHAQEVSPVEAPELYAMVQDLAARAGLPAPKVYVIPEEAPNAFATGRNPQNGVVAVTAGLLRILDRREVAAVVAHELGHIKHRDTLIMAVAATFAGALSMLANAAMFGSLFGGNHSSEDEDGGSPLTGLLGVLIAPIAATLVQMSISRAREFLADEAAARYTGTPLALASALRKIEAWSREIPMHAGSPATAHMFIHNPFSAERLAGLFSTHPPTEQRVARLMGMASGRLQAAA
ncbi:MAG: zinc metalloprotease HtpX [Acidobacteria bacterium]|nr:zinc metalloprotease HtpX [Acidobacteriota bacterium]